MRKFSRKGQGRTVGVVAAWVGAVILASVGGPAQGVMAAGTGPLNDVDPEAATVEIRDQTYSVTSRSVLLDRSGKKMSILELEAESAPWVIFRTRPGAPRRILDTLQIVDEDADEVD